MRLRWRATLITSAVVAFAATAVAGYRLNADVEPHGRRLYDEALTARQRGEWGLAKHLLVEAWAANPRDLSPMMELARSGDLSLPPAGRAAFLDSVALSVGDSALARCVRTMVGEGVHLERYAALARERHPLTRACGRFVLDSRRPDTPKDLPQRYPLKLWVVDYHVGATWRDDPATTWEFVRGLAHSDNHPMIRAAAFAAGHLALHALDRHDEAAEWEREALRRARAWGPGALHLVLESHRTHVDYLKVPSPDSVSRHAHQVAEAARIELKELLPLVDRLLRALILQSLAVQLQDGGRLTEANETFDRLLSLADTMDDPRVEALARARRGRGFVKLGRLQVAEQDLRRARSLGKSMGELTVQRESAHDLLHLYEAIGKPDSAIAAGRDFASYADALGTTASRMMAHHDLAWLLRRHGRHADAERAFQRMLADIDSVGDSHFWAGEYLEHAGQPEHARLYYLRATRNPQDRSRAFAGLVRTNEALGDVSEARRFAQIADRDTGGWHPEYSPVMPGLLARLGDTAQAREQFRLARANVRAAGRTQAAAQVALEWADLELRLGAAATARALADSAAAAAHSLGVGELEVRAKATAALASLHAGAESAALVVMDSVVRRGDAMHIPQLSAELHYLRGSALRRAGQYRRAMTAFDRASAWVDSTAGRIEADPSRVSFRATHLRVSGGALDMLARDTRYPDRLERYSRWSSRRKGGSLHGDARLLRALQRRLDPDQAIVDYVSLDSTVVALAITRGSVDLLRLPLPATLLRAKIARFRLPIVPRVGSAIDVAHIGFDETVARQLYDGLLAPLLPRLTQQRRLVIIPDGMLFMLPFDALVSSREGARRYVLDDFTISYATRLDALSGTPRAAPHRPAVAVAGPETQAGSREEIGALSVAYGDALHVLDGSTATKAMVAERARTAGVIHFATHAEANDLNPDLARLALAAGSEDGGWLNAFEIRAWKLDGALVVLSACETAVGRLAGGEGALSLNRAFLQAGAAGTVATLWPIGTPTAILMKAFYRELVSGATPAAALRTARTELREAGFDHPFYWAPFVYTTRQLE